MRANKRLSLSEADLLSLIQLYPNGCDVAEAADVLQVGENDIRRWVEAGWQLRAGIQYKLSRIVAGDNQFEWAGEE